jgi:hypothetical protein
MGCVITDYSIDTDLVFKRIRQEESRAGGLNTAQNALIFSLAYCQPVAAMCETTYTVHLIGVLVNRELKNQRTRELPRSSSYAYK